MKRLLSLLALTLTLNAAQQEADLVKGVDLTGQSSISANLLNQLVDNGIVKSTRGLVLVTNMAPAVLTYNRWTNYLWLDTSTTPRSLKYWTTPGLGSNPNDGTNWTTIAGYSSSGSGSISGSNLITSSVGTDKLADLSVTTAKLDNNSVTSGKIGTDAIQTDKIAALAVTTDKLAAGAVTGAKIADNTIPSGKLMAGSIYETNFATGVISNSITYSIITNLLWNGGIVSNMLSTTAASGSIPANTITSNQIVSVDISKITAPTASGYLLGTTNTSGIPVWIKQGDASCVYSNIITPISLTSGDTTIAEISFTNRYASSKIRLSASIYVANDGDDAYNLYFKYNDSARITNAVAANGSYTYITFMTNFPAAGTSNNFKLTFKATAGSAYGSTATFPSQFIVEELP